MNWKKYTKKWLVAASIRSLRTMAQAFIATIGSSTYIGEVNWQLVASATILAGILSFVTSLAGLPEVPDENIPALEDKENGNN